MDNGSTIGMDRFGMEHTLSDERRIDTVVALADLGYADRMILSHDAAFFSHVTPPSWRAANAPSWTMDHLSRRILPVLRQRGVSAGRPRPHARRRTPRRLLEPSRGDDPSMDAMTC